MFQSLGLLVISNLFMTFAWYGHLKSNQHSKLWIVILISWGIAFFEYCFQVPANRIGINYLSLGQLKVMQEIITMTVFGLFSIFYMKIPLTKNFFFASICLVLAAFFIFRDQGQGV
jgi:uncharacterized protein (DUF486 family)